jgi:hypothetical protein
MRYIIDKELYLDCVPSPQDFEQGVQGPHLLQDGHSPSLQVSPSYINKSKTSLKRVAKIFKCKGKRDGNIIS